VSIFQSRYHYAYYNKLETSSAGTANIAEKSDCHPANSTSTDSNIDTTVITTSGTNADTVSAGTGTGNSIDEDVGEVTNKSTTDLHKSYGTNEMCANTNRDTTTDDGNGPAGSHGITNEDCLVGDKSMDDYQNQGPGKLEIKLANL
jgi:hypothetical protein